MYFKASLLSAVELLKIQEDHLDQYIQEDHLDQYIQEDHLDQYRQEDHLHQYMRGNKYKQILHDGDNVGGSTDRKWVCQ